MSRRSVVILLFLAAVAVVLLVRGFGADHEHASGSPDSAASGRLVIAKLYSQRTAGISLIDPDGTHLVTLTRHAGWIDDDPAWSPDHHWIAFTRTTNGYGSFHVFLMRPSGSGVHRLTSGRFDERPAWSPDSAWVIYQSTDGLQRIRPSGQGRRVVIPTTEAVDPAWSPDGKRIAFSQGGFVWTSSPSGRGRKRIVAGREPDWSPNGRRIAFTPPNGGVATVSAGGADRRYLSPGLLPAWDPSGNRLAYTRWPPNLQFSVWVMREDASGKHLLSRDARSADWRP